MTQNGYQPTGLSCVERFTSNSAPSTAANQGMAELGARAPAAAVVGAAARERLLGIFLARSAVVFTDAEGRVEFATPEASRLTGLSPEELLGKRLLDLLLPEETDTELRAQLGSRVRKGEAFEDEGLLRAPQGGKRSTRLCVLPELDAAGHCTSVTWVLDSLCTEERVEGELRRAREDAFRAARLKSEFLATISHELRTPLNGILGMAQLLLEEDLSPSQRESLTLLRSSGMALLKMLNDSLDLAKLEAGRLEFEAVPFSLRKLLLELISNASAQPHSDQVELKASLAADVPLHVLGDPLRTRQVVTNLLANAVKFTSAGSVELGCACEGGGVAIWVKDTGIGIPEDRLAAVFEPFTQVDSSISRRFGGTGLGLTICRKLVAQMGGRIQVQSRLGVGSAFHVWLPLHATASAGQSGLHQAARLEVQPTPSGEAPPSLRLLVVEDHPVNALMVSRLLEKDGHVVEIAENGKVALSLVERHSYDLILMDIHMPEMDGLQATRAVRQFERERGTRTPIVALTAHANEGDDERCRAAGMDEYLRKPIDFKRLRQVIQRFAGARRHGELERREAVARLGDDEELYRTVLAAFLECLPASKLALADSLAMLNFEGLARAAHSAKGSLLAIGAVRASKMAQRVVDSAKRSDLESLPAEVDQLDQAFDSVSRSVSAELARGD